MSDKGFRRFRIARKVKDAPATPPAPPATPKDPETYAQKVMREVETDTADKGSPEMDRAVSKGCMGCLRVTVLFFLIMLASIVATWFIRRQGV
jgi:hypothetical protein